MPVVLFIFEDIPIREMMNPSGFNGATAVFCTIGVI